MTLRGNSLWLLVFAGLLVAVSGCGQQERDTLKARLAEIEQKQANADAALAARDDIIAELRNRLVTTETALAQCTTRADDTGARIYRLEAERDKLRAELKALKPKPQ